MMTQGDLGLIPVLRQLLPVLFGFFSSASVSRGALGRGYAIGLAISVRSTDVGIFRDFGMPERHFKEKLKFRNLPG